MSDTFKTGDNFISISQMITEYAKSIHTDNAKDILTVTIMPLVCTVIDDLVNEGKIKLC